MSDLPVFLRDALGKHVVVKGKKVFIGKIIFDKEAPTVYVTVRTVKTRFENVQCRVHGGRCAGYTLSMATVSFDLLPRDVKIIRFVLKREGFSRPQHWVVGLNRLREYDMVIQDNYGADEYTIPEHECVEVRLGLLTPKVPSLRGDLGAWQELAQGGC